MSHYTEPALKKLKNDELKEILSSLKQSTIGKKDVLVARILSVSSVDSSIGENKLPFQEPPEKPFTDSNVEEGLSTLVLGFHPREKEESSPQTKRMKLELEEKEGEVKDGEAGTEDDNVNVTEVYSTSNSAIPFVMEDIDSAEQVEEDDTFSEPVNSEEVTKIGPTDMYLDTVNRKALDFDFERLCSVTLSHINVYACLTCGKYFQGRGKNSPAYAHSIAEDHHVYINLTTHKVFILPDSYEVTDPSLDDIKHLLFPTFTTTSLSKIDHSTLPAYDLFQNPYYPGFVGLNNIKANSYMNAIIHALVHVIPLRDYFILDPTVSTPGATELVKRFSMICRKIWNPKAFKAQVSPHELLQECASASGKRFKITESGDPLEFLSWFLNQLHQDLGGTKRSGSSIIYKAFQGEVKVDDQQVLTSGEYGGKPRFDLDREIKSSRSTFLLLAIDLPVPPVFQDAVEKNIIPQVPISTVLAKYNGSTTHEVKGVLRRYKITKLPPFLILHIRRFTKNNFVEEKNPTIVNFPLRGIDFNEYVDSTADIATYYDLVSNITHSSAAGTAREETTWKTQVHLKLPRDESGNILDNRSEDDEKWFQIQDLIVDEINRGMIALGESYIQIWERRKLVAY